MPRTSTGDGTAQAEQDYLWRIIQKLSQQRLSPQSRENAENGVVVARLTIAHDGRLLDVALAASSGFSSLDASVISAIRKASPFPALPPDIDAGQRNFVVPIGYSRER
jgi:protein TonB